MLSVQVQELGKVVCVVVALCWQMWLEKSRREREEPI